MIVITLVTSVEETGYLLPFVGLPCVYQQNYWKKLWMKSEFSVMFGRGRSRVREQSERIVMNWICSRCFKILLMPKNVYF